MEFSIDIKRLENYFLNDSYCCQLDGCNFLLVELAQPSLLISFTQPSITAIE